MMTELNKIINERKVLFSKGQSTWRIDNCVSYVYVSKIGFSTLGTLCNL